jgi:subtilisin family serine protease
MSSPFPVSRRFLLCAILVLASACAFPPASGAARRPHGFVRVLVKLRHEPPRAWQHVLAGLGARSDGRLRHLRVQIVRVPRARAAAAVRRLRRSPSVAFAERNRVVLHITAANYVQALPSDPLWRQQWGAAKLDAPVAWAVTKGSPDVVVAVLDTGVDFTQPDLQGAFVPGYDFVNHDADPTDDHGHGTAVAGVVAARADNGIGGSGLCPRCSIMPVKVVGADGTATELNVASGITWAADHGARVINLSLGGSYGSTVADAVRYATDKGVLVVAAAGNNGSSTPFYPAAYAGALSVGATQADDTLYAWSDFGSWVAVAAPGCDQSTGLNNTYVAFCGTSASTPVVAGLAALAMSYAPNASTDAIRSAITSTAQHVSGVAYGRVDAAATLSALGARFAAAPPPPATPSSPSGSTPAPAPVSARLTTAGAAGAAHPAFVRRHRSRRRWAGPKGAWMLRLIPVERFAQAH